MHSIGMMMGFHAVKMWQNETFHCRIQLNEYHHPDSGIGREASSYDGSGRLGKPHP
jgi:hypothetical protein